MEALAAGALHVLKAHVNIAFLVLLITVVTSIVRAVVKVLSRDVPSLRALAMTGSIVSLNEMRQRGVLRGEDGLERPFRRTGLVVYGAWHDLTPGGWVRFDGDSGWAINVEPDRRKTAR